MNAKAPCGHMVVVPDEEAPDGALAVQCGEPECERQFNVQVVPLPPTAGGALYVNAWAETRVLT